eukprot:5887765-Prymnesium_polylepis.2
MRQKQVPHVTRVQCEFGRLAGAHEAKRLNTALLREYVAERGDQVDEHAQDEHKQQTDNGIH